MLVPGVSLEGAVISLLALRPRGVGSGRAGVGRCQLAIARGPHALETVAEAQEEGARSQCHEGYQERVFDKILTLFIVV